MHYRTLEVPLFSVRKGNMEVAEPNDLGFSEYQLALGLCMVLRIRLICIFARGNLVPHTEALGCG